MVVSLFATWYSNQLSSLPHNFIVVAHKLRWVIYIDCLAIEHVAEARHRRCVVACTEEEEPSVPIAVVSSKEETL